MYYDANNHFPEHGVHAEKISYNWDEIQADKDRAVTQLTGGVAFLCKKNKVEVIKGTGTITDPKTITIDNGQTLNVDNIIIATGSESVVIPNIDVDEETIITSTGALALKQVPESMAIIGGGVIGLEMASVYSRLGTKCTVVDRNVIPGGKGLDAEIGKSLLKSLKKQGLNFLLEHGLDSIEKGDGSVKLSLENAKGKKVPLEVEKVLLSIGRKPYHTGLGLENIGVTPNDYGQIPINSDYTVGSHKNIFAIGDVVDGPMLAHKATHEGVFVAEQLAGIRGHIDHNTVPGVIYTTPEVATVGKSEEDLKEAGIPYKSFSFPNVANSRSKTYNLPDGLVKVLAHKDTDELLGVHAMGEGSGEYISTAVSIMTYKGSAEDLSRLCFPHPSFSESLLEAAIGCTTGKAIHA